jgi:hypothetical protein
MFFLAGNDIIPKTTNRAREVILSDGSSLNIGISEEIASNEKRK